jgi:hypothetical protein
MTATALNDGDSPPLSGAGDKDPDIIVDAKEAADADANGAVFLIYHGAIGNYMLLHALGMGIKVYGRSREYKFGVSPCWSDPWVPIVTL